MQKKLLALAAAAAISTPAFAETANVTIYGKVIMDAEHVSSNNVGTNALGANVAGSQTRVVSNASRLGFKGREDLGGGMYAIFQYEAEFAADGAGPVGPFVATRNSNVGVESSLGTLFMGNWDTPFKVAHNQVELFDNTTFASTGNLMGRINGSNLTMNARLKDSVQYWTPKLSGFQARLAVGMDDGKASSTANPQVFGTSQTVTSASATYENEFVYAGLAFQKYSDTLGAGPNAGTGLGGAKFSGTRLVAAYKADDDTQIGVIYEKLKADVPQNFGIPTPALGGGTIFNPTGVPAGVPISRNAIELSAKTAVGAHNFGAAYVKAADTHNASLVGPNPASIPGANQLSLRYGYNLSKRAEFFAMYSAVRNKTNAVGAGNYGFSTTSSVNNSKLGAAQTGFGAGMIIIF